uniref:FAM20 C-terminal domain-containing protein n=1 Tax=Romanomermis culicivorax TaxID=13658 RepID=A0A915IVD4_ROMCU
MAKVDDWDKFYAQIGTCDLYRENSRLVENLLRTVATSPIKHIANLDSGTQVKFIVTFHNGKRALFKPMRFSRNFETHEDQFYFTDFERHNAEIAAFHLDRNFIENTILCDTIIREFPNCKQQYLFLSYRLLGFRRAVPTVGRVVNMTDEFLPNAEKTLARTFFYSPAKNLCFVGKCDYYCDTTHAVCGKPDLVEGSFQAFLPDDEDVPRDHVRSPYKRTYSKRSQIALWQKDPGYCNWKVKYLPPYSNGRALLDLVDLYIFDFLMGECLDYATFFILIFLRFLQFSGNQDRHHYETITVFEEPINFLHLDNGRGFGKTTYDDMDILAPLSQCCVVRPSTLKTLLNFYAGPRTLGQSLAESLTKDPVDPVLSDGHLRAVDRRLEIILRVVHRCIFDVSHGRADKVLMDTFFNPEAPAEAEEEEEDDD